MTDTKAGKNTLTTVHSNTPQGEWYCKGVRYVKTDLWAGFWSIFKRGVMGTFHKMSAKYMPLYVAKFQFRL
jgi:hypothetical protein